MTATYAKCGGTETRGCGHVWPALSGPTTMNAALDALRTLTCPNCGQGPTGIFLASKAEIEASAAMTDLPTFHCPKWPQCGCPDGAFNDDCPAIAAKRAATEPPITNGEKNMKTTPALGLFGTDIVTGFSGTITGVCNYLTGCTQICLTLKVDKDSKPRDAQWYDIERVEVDDSIAKVTVNVRPSGGPSNASETAPTR